MNRILWFLQCAILVLAIYTKEHRLRHRPRLPKSYSVKCDACSFPRYTPWSLGTFSHGFIHKPYGASFAYNAHLHAGAMSEILYTHGRLVSLSSTDITTGAFSKIYANGNITITGYEIPWMHNKISVNGHSKAWFQGSLEFRSFFQITEKEFSNLKLQSSDAFFGSGTNISLSGFSTIDIRSNQNWVAKASSHGDGNRSSVYYSFTLPKQKLPSLCLTENNLLLVQKYSELHARGLFVLDQRANLRVSDHSMLKIDHHAGFILLQDGSFDVNSQSKFVVKRFSRVAVAPRIHFRTPERSLIIIGPNMLCAIIREVQAKYFNGRDILIANEFDSNRYRFLVCRSRENGRLLVRALEWYLRYDLPVARELSAALLEN